MANYGSDDVVVELDNAAGSLVNISQQVITLGGIEKEALLEETHAMGDSWVESLFTGISKMGDIALGGLYDDTASTSVNALAGANDDLGDIRTLKITFGSTKTCSVEVVIQKFRRIITRGELTKYELSVRPTGAPTEA